MYRSTMWSICLYPTIHSSSWCSYVGLNRTAEISRENDACITRACSSPRCSWWPGFFDDTFESHLFIYTKIFLDCCLKIVCREKAIQKTKDSERSSGGDTAPLQVCGPGQDLHPWSLPPLCVKVGDAHGDQNFFQALTDYDSVILP